MILPEIATEWYKPAETVVKLILSNPPIKTGVVELVDSPWPSVPSFPSPQANILLIWCRSSNKLEPDVFVTNFSLRGESIYDRYTKLI